MNTTTDHLDIKLQIVGNRFTWGDPDQRHGYAWYDITDPDTVQMILVQERHDLLWYGRFSSGVELAVQLRAAGLLTEEPLPVSEYATKLRALSEEVGEPLPDYIRRVREVLSEL